MRSQPWADQGACSAPRGKEEHIMQPRNHERLSRRAFLHRGALASFGVGLLPFTGGAQQLPQARAEVRRYVPLGRTGMQISDVSFGASRLDAGEEVIVQHAFER